jgi:uncharacterized membrane protein YbhN (UPF0104 family)
MLAVAQLILCVQTLLLAIRWRQIAAICGAEMSAAKAVRFVFIGLFFGQVLPSTAGGDAARIWLLARDGAGWPAAAYSVLIDRVIGVSALAAIVVICMPWTFQLIHDQVAREALALLGFGVLAGALLFVALGAPHLKVMERWWFTRQLVTASRLSWQLARSPTGLRVAVLSIAIHLMTVAATFGAAKAAHASVELTQVMVLVLPVFLVATVPISIAGWGVRESAMALAFSYAGLPASDGLVVSILFGLATLALGVIGGIVWVISGPERRGETSEQGGAGRSEEID